jgi:ribosome modulation factor
MVTNASEAISNDEALDWMHKVMAQQRRCDEENSALRLIYKQIKAAGHNEKAMRRAIRNGKIEPETVVNNLRDEIRYSGLRHIPVTPESLFDGMDFAITEKTQAGQDLWDAEETGYRAGRHGVPVEDCPYPPGSELHVHWTDWWRKGKAAQARELGPDATVATARRGRGRPRRKQDPLPLENKPVRQTRTPRRTGQRSARRRGPVVATENGATVY